MYLNIIYNLYEKPMVLYYGFQNQENWLLIFSPLFLQGDWPKPDIRIRQTHTHTL